MTKEQVVEKFKDFQQAVAEYNKVNDKNASSKIGIFAVLGVANEENTAVSSSNVVVGSSGVIKTCLQGVLEKDSIRQLVLSAMTEPSLDSVLEQVIDAFSKDEPETIKP